MYCAKLIIRNRFHGKTLCTQTNDVIMLDRPRPQTLGLRHIYVSWQQSNRHINVPVIIKWYVLNNSIKKSWTKENTNKYENIHNTYSSTKGVWLIELRMLKWQGNVARMAKTSLELFYSRILKFNTINTRLSPYRFLRQFHSPSILMTGFPKIKLNVSFQQVSSPIFCMNFLPPSIRTTVPP
jgi:hypothetical protein